MDRIDVIDITSAEATEPTVKSPEFGDGQVAPGRRVTMHFELRLPDGKTVDSNFSSKPVEFTVGDGNILPGFEQVILGLQPGDEGTFTVPAQSAFGERNSGNLHKYARHRFPADLALKEGLMLNFADSAGNDQPGVVAGIDGDQVTVDFNHPLAGRDILFRVRILAVAAHETDRDKT